MINAALTQLSSIDRYVGVILSLSIKQMQTMIQRCSLMSFSFLKILRFNSNIVIQYIQTAWIITYVMTSYILDFVIYRKGKKKPVEPEIKENRPYLEEQYIHSFIREISEIKELVPLPPSIDLNEWIATNSMC